MLLAFAMGSPPSIGAINWTSVGAGNRASTLTGIRTSVGAGALSCCLSSTVVVLEGANGILFTGLFGSCCEAKLELH